MGIWPQNVFLEVPCFFISVFGVKCPFFDGWHSFFFLWFIFWTFLKEFQRKRDIMREKMGIRPQTGGLWKSKLFLKNSFLHSEPSNLLWLRLGPLGNWTTDRWTNTKMTKMSVTHKKMGIWPRKLLWRRMGPLKTRFGVKSPFFHLKGPLLFSGVMINRLRNLFKGKKVGVAHKKWVFDLYNTSKTPFCSEMSQWRLSFGQILSLNDIWSLKIPICKSFLLR